MKLVPGNRARGIAGWALQTIIHLSTTTPDLLRVALLGSDLRRQGIFLACAAYLRFGPDTVISRLNCTSEQEFATYLVRQRVRDILAVLPVRPAGLLGALARLGPNPLVPETLWTMVDLLEDDGPRGRALAQVGGRISADLIEVAARVDPIAARPDILASLCRAEDAIELNAMINVARQRTLPTARSRRRLIRFWPRIMSPRGSQVLRGQDAEHSE